MPSDASDKKDQMTSSASTFQSRSVVLQRGRYCLQKAEWVSLNRSDTDIRETAFCFIVVVAVLELTTCPSICTRFSL